MSGLERNLSGRIPKIASIESMTSSCSIDLRNFVASCQEELTSTGDSGVLETQKGHLKQQSNQLLLPRHPPR